MLTFMFKLLGRKSACKTFAGSNEILRWLTPFLGPNMDPRVQNWITFSFLLLGLCLGPVLGSRFGPKSGASHRKILLLPADVLQADLRRTSMSVSVNTCFFSLCVPICFLTVASGLGTHKEKRYVLTFMFKLLGRKSACKTFAGSNEILRWLTPFLGPNMDPKMGSRIGSHFHSFF